MAQEGKVRARVLVSGEVQGVCFRAYALEEARARGVDGWVRNLADGRVELVVAGSRENVDAMIRWCRRGSPYARVEDVGVNWEAEVGDLRGFRIAH
jgi:acylphosphatase